MDTSPLRDNWNVEKVKIHTRFPHLRNLNRCTQEKKKKLHRFKKTSFPKEADAKAIILQTNTISARSQVMSFRLFLKSIMSNHRRMMKSNVPLPLCLTVTFYLCLHSSLSLLFNACLFLSIPLCIILSAEILPAIAGEVAAYFHAYFILSLNLGLLSPVCNS